MRRDLVQKSKALRKVRHFYKFFPRNDNRDWIAPAAFLLISIDNLLVQSQLCLYFCPSNDEEIKKSKWREGNEEEVVRFFNC